MKLTKPVKILIGALTLFDVLYPLLFALVYTGIMIFFISSIGIASQTEPDPNELLKLTIPWLMIFPVMFCYSFLALGLRIFYIIHEIKNSLLTETYRILFVLGTFFMPIVAMPVYFILYLWKDNPQEPGAGIQE
jgi:hypothetical protein